MKKRYIPLSIIIMLLTCCSNNNSIEPSNSISSIIPSNDEISSEPTVEPTIDPTIEPTVEPTVEPTIEPTIEPTPEPEPFTITYNSNGGIGVMEEQTVNSETFFLMENEFYKPGFNFLGWSLQPNGIVDYIDCEEVFGSITEDTTLYAIYEYSSDKICELVDEYSKYLNDGLNNVVAFYGGQNEQDITKYIPEFIPELANSIELQYGKLVYVGTNEKQYELMTSSFIPISQSYKGINEISSLDAYLELAYSYYYQGTQLQYDQGSSYQRKIRTMKPEDATNLYHKYLDCSTYVSNAFYNAFDDIVVKGSDIHSITTKVLINYAKENINKSNEVIMYKDNLQSMNEEEKATALQEFKDTIQPGDLYVYRHKNDGSGHVMLYVGDGYFLHSTGSSYNYSSLVDKEEEWTSVSGEVNPEGTVRYQSANSTVYKKTSSRYLFYNTSSDSNDRYALLRPLNRKNLKLSSTTVARCMMSGIDIEKSADKATSVTLGDSITYTITITNNSKKVINNVSINDTIPTNTSFVDMDRSYYYNTNGTNIIFNIPSIDPKSKIKVSYTVKVDDNADLIGKTLTSQGKVSHIDLNTLNLSISSLSSTQLQDFVTMALQYYDNKNVYYDANGNNSSKDPTKNIVTFKNGASFITALYKRYYASLGKEVDLSKELTEVTNTNFMNLVMDKDGKFNESTIIYSMMVNGGYGGTAFTKDYTMDRMRTIEREYLLPGDLISFTSSTATNQYLYLGDITFNSVKYENALLVFTTSDGVKLVYGADADVLLDKFIGYKRFAIIRPSLYY